MALNWNSLFMNGSLVDFSVSSWGGKTRIKPSDLGIDDSAEVQKILTLGHHRLAPKKAFADIDMIANRARSMVDNYSIRFRVIDGTRYVPTKHLKRVAEKLDAYRIEFDEAVEAFIENYEQMKTEQMPDIEKALQDAAKTPEAAEQALERIREEYPSTDQVRAKFGMDWTFFSMTAPKTGEIAGMVEQESRKVKHSIAVMVNQLRDELTDKLKTLLTITKKGGKLSTSSIGSALDLLTRVESLNVLGDEVLSDQISSLRTALTSVDRADVGEDFIGGLEGVQRALEESVEEAIKQAENNLTGLGKRRIG